MEFLKIILTRAILITAFAKTTRLVCENLNLEEKSITTFQSRLGNAEWLKPYTSEVMKSLPKEGCKNIMVIAPGFVSIARNNRRNR